jgi:hypothetical protein
MGSKPSTTKAGVKLVNNGWHLAVKNDDRTPPYATDYVILDDTKQCVIYN